jgi:hypothetical protein
MLIRRRSPSLIRAVTQRVSIRISETCDRLSEAEEGGVLVTWDQSVSIESSPHEFWFLLQIILLQDIPKENQSLCLARHNVRPYDSDNSPAKARCLGKFVQKERACFNMKWLSSGPLQDELLNSTNDFHRFSRKAHPLSVDAKFARCSTALGFQG